MSSNIAVAVLLATYNGSRHIESQIRSLAENRVPFTVHWLDDHSTDNTRELLRGAVERNGLQMREWNQPDHLGFPRTFLRLLECVEADVYLFCDQDDIWQPGKIDATVNGLTPHLAQPRLCFSDPWVFRDDKPNQLFRLIADHVGLDIDIAARESTSFVFCPAFGHTQGFTLPLRELFLRHRSVAFEYALSHDRWMYVLAHASGTPIALKNVPTTLYRIHSQNVSGLNIGIRSFLHPIEKLRPFQALRRTIAWHAEGFEIASSTLPPSEKLERLRKLAKQLLTLDSKQSLGEFLALIRCNLLPRAIDPTLWLSLSCLFSDSCVLNPAGSKAEPRHGCY